jgi:hypothetical protein
MVMLMYIYIKTSSCSLIPSYYYAYISQYIYNLTHLPPLPLNLSVQLSFCYIEHENKLRSLKALVLHPVPEPPYEHITSFVNLLIHVELQPFNLPVASDDINDGRLV